MHRESRRRRHLGGVACLILLCVLLGGLIAPPTAWAGASDPLWAYSPQPPPPGTPPIPPPDGSLNDPCGLAVDGNGNFYLADHYHHVVDLFSPAHAYLNQLSGLESLDGPCGLALGGGGQLYVNEYHRSVREYGPAPGFSPGPLLSGAGLDSAHPTGVAVDPASGEVYVNERTYVGVYDAAGAPIEEGGVPLRIGLGNLEDGYGLAVSAYPGTAGYVYVPDAATDTIKVYDPAATDKVDPVQTIAGPPGGFSSLREAAVAVDRVTGELYVTDDLQPEYTESPHALVEVFNSAGAYEGHLKYEITDGAPSGLAVDNSAQATQGRVYVSSGNTQPAGLYAYPPGAATMAVPLPGGVPPPPRGGSSIFPTVAVGGAAESGEGILCEGDACQVLPPEPQDPTLTTLLEGRGNPKVRYHRYKHRPKPHKHRHRRHRRGRWHKRGRRAAGRASTSGAAGSTSPAAASSPTPASGAAPASAPRAAALAPPAAGLDAHAWADGGEAATLAGSHPYALRLGFGLDQGSGEADLRNLRIELPPGLLLDPATAGFCIAARLTTPRSSPFEASASGESCPDRSQVGTIEVGSGGHEPRSFGLFELEPAAGTAARLGAAPFGTPLLFDAHLGEGEEGGAHLTLQASEVPQSLALHGLTLTLWGTPWDATHNAERGNCLDEAEPSFGWARCSVGDPANSDNSPLALLTLPTQCGGPLAFSVQAESWGGAAFSEEALNRDSGGRPALLSGCETLNFEPRVNGVFSVKKASSASGFAFRLTNENPGIFNPRLRAASQARTTVVRLPAGTTLNPSLGAGLETCTEAQVAAESPTGIPGSGCPNGSKIGDFSLRFPFYKGILEGAIYLAEPYRNPYGSLIAVYLVAKSAGRGILVRASGKLIPNPNDGTLTAYFEGLPQLPYTDLEVNFRSGQRAPLVSPPACGPASARIELAPWAQGAPTRLEETESPIETGIEDGPCPTGAAPPFEPGAVAGGVNSNVGSYTPYFVHIKRRDTEQEITSYSLILPKGITGKLAGIPFCPDAAIEAARTNTGVAETEHPSCPAASQVGHTLTGYGVGQALTYSPGRIYLAGPYHGAPLSLVTIDAATIGPFDLGTIVIRSAFDLDPLTAQLQIDSRASDPIPHLLDGIPLHLRDIRVYVDRPQFTHNPSSCEPSRLESTLTGSGPPYTDPHEASATATSHFQLLNCLTLGFKPKLGVRLRDGTRRGSYPELRATFQTRGPQDSNLKDMAVVLPRQMFVAQEHIRGICAVRQFDAEQCPSSSIYGHAAAYTPLFDQPLTGNVYLRSNPSHSLPDLVADLHSGSIRVVVEGAIGPSKGGGVLTQFTDLPDAPISRFVMTLDGGRRGLLINSTDICAAPPTVSVKALGQNNRGSIFTTELRGRCGKRGGRR